MIVLSCFWLGYLGEGVRHFNRHVDFSALRYALSRLVSHRRTILCSGVSAAEVSGFTNSQKRWEKIGMPDVNIRKKGDIY